MRFWLLPLVAVVGCGSGEDPEELPPPLRVPIVNGSFDFGPVQMGMPSALAPVIVTANLYQESVVQAELIGSSAFVLEVDECTGISLLPHSSCLLGVRFTPQQEDPGTAVLQIGDVEVDFVGVGWPMNESWVSERSGLDYPRLIPALAGENLLLVYNHSGDFVMNFRGETVARPDVFVDAVEIDCDRPAPDGEACFARVQFLPFRVGGYVDTVFVSGETVSGEILTTPVSVAGVALPPNIWPEDTSDLPPPDLPQP